MVQGWQVVLIAIVFEGALGLAGWGLSTWLGVPLAPRLVLSPAVGLRCALASAPMFLLLAYITRTRWKPLADLRTQVESLVGEFFRGVSWPGLAAVSIAAGVGEEVLFRGALQPLAERWWGPTIGLVATSVLFGAAHMVSRVYFVFAMAVGMYLGWLAQQTGELLTPITVHAAYDFVALLVLRSRAASNAIEVPAPIVQ